MLAVRPSAEARTLLALRRSANKQFMGAPGPSPDDLDELLQVAARVPDHRKLAPWRFVVFEGDARKDEPPPKAEGADVPKPGKAVAAGAGAGAMNDANGLPPAGLGKLSPADAWPGAGGGAVSLTFAKMPAPLAPAPMPSIAT